VRSTWATRTGARWTRPELSASSKPPRPNRPPADAAPVVGVPRVVDERDQVRAGGRGRPGSAGGFRAAASDDRPRFSATLSPKARTGWLSAQPRHAEMMGAQDVRRGRVADQRRAAPGEPGPLQGSALSSSGSMTMIGAGAGARAFSQLLEHRNRQRGEPGEDRRVFREPGLQPVQAAAATAPTATGDRHRSASRRGRRSARAAAASGGAPQARGPRDARSGRRFGGCPTYSCRIPENTMPVLLICPRHGRYETVPRTRGPPGRARRRRSAPIVRRAGPAAGPPVGRRGPPSSSAIVTTSVQSWLVWRMDATSHASRRASAGHSRKTHAPQHSRQSAAVASHGRGAATRDGPSPDWMPCGVNTSPSPPRGHQKSSASSVPDSLAVCPVWCPFETDCHATWH